MTDSMTTDSMTETDTHTTATNSADDWGSALAEQAALAPSTAAPTTEQTSEPVVEPSSESAATPAPVFQPLSGSPASVGHDIDLIMDVPVQLTVELGRARMTIKQLLQLGQGSVVELNNLAGEPMDVYVNGYLIAQGEVVVVEDRYGIRLTDVITPSERINRLNSQRFL